MNNLSITSDDNFDKDLTRIKALKVKSNSILVNGFVIIKIGRNRYKIGEPCGDWLFTGSANDVCKRAYRMPIYPHPREVA